MLRYYLLIWQRHVKDTRPGQTPQQRWRASFNVYGAPTSPDVQDTSLKTLVQRCTRWTSRLSAYIPRCLRHRPWGKERTIAVLVALFMPLLLTVLSLVQDYVIIRDLGRAGLSHLLAAKRGLSELSQLERTLGIASDRSAGMTISPYTLLVQRQAGTSYETQVSIQPSSTLQRAGIKPMRYKAALGTNMTVPLEMRSTAPAASGATATDSNMATRPNSLVPSPQALHDAQIQFQAAQQDFQALQTRLGHLGRMVSLASGLPPVGAALSTTRTLANIGYDGATLGALYAGAAVPLLTKLHGKSLTGNEPLLGQRDLAAVEETIARSQPTLDALQAELERVDVSILPLSDALKAELSSVKAELPKLRSDLSQAGTWLNAVAWLLGTDQARNFLLETLDRTELRASGGFTGDFAILHIRDGKIAPLSLVPVARTDYSGKAWDDGWDLGRRPPAAYSWWPIAHWGLRDANLAADYPTTAQLTMTAYQGECGAACQAAGLPASVDGVIQVTPAVIEQLLQVTGPMRIPDYDVTVTPTNLEYEIHYFSLQRWDGSYPPGPNNGQLTDRKDFFYELGHLLEQRVRNLPQRAFVSIARMMLADIRAKDIQIYVTNPSVESSLAKLGMAGTLATLARQDSFFVVQTNVTGAKANPCVQVMQTDNVTLDDKGGATHHLTVSMYHIGGAGTQGNCDPWHAEFPTYHAYMRIYAPAAAQLRSADGFDQNQPMCPANCSADPYPGGELVCPPGGYNPGTHMPTIGPMGDEAGVLDKVGGPTQTTSDVPGMTLWGGFVVIPPDCTAHLTLTWYVPGVVHWPRSPTA
jgi:hypothetical protein